MKMMADIHRFKPVIRRIRRHAERRLQEKRVSYQLTSYPKERPGDGLDGGLQFHYSCGRSLGMRLVPWPGIGGVV